MTIPGLVTVIIPSRNEVYLHRTIRDLLDKAAGDIQIIAILDGYWPAVQEIIEDPRVNYLHRSTPCGMRNGINSAVAIAKGEYILKTDAHCMFGVGYDNILKDDCAPNWIIVPRRYALDPVKWEIEENPKYPIDYMYLSKDLHGMPWTERNRNLLFEERLIDDLMSAQGSCWFMKKDYYNELELLDEENWGTFYNEFQEIGLKCWLSGGLVQVNKKTWYAHWHKPREVGRGYNLPNTEQQKAIDYLNYCVELDRLGKRFFKNQVYSIDWLIDKFAPVPTWEGGEANGN